MSHRTKTTDRMTKVFPATSKTIIACLTEGQSIRATERISGIHGDTIMRLSARVGPGAAELHDRNEQRSGASADAYDSLGAPNSIPFDKPLAPAQLVTPSLSFSTGVPTT
jgi:hypothetical protein